VSEDALVPKGGGLPTRASRDVQLATAARTSAARSLVVSTLTFGHLPITLPAMAAPLFALLYGMGMSVGGTLAIGNGLLLLLGGGMTWVAAKAMAPSVRASALQSRDEGKAAAAGASLSLAGFLSTMVLGTHAYIWLTFGTPWLWLGTLRMMVVALTVGLFGGILFREVERATGNENARLPRLYRGLAAASVPIVGGHFLMGLGGFSPFGPAGIVMILLGLLAAGAVTRESPEQLEAGDAATLELPEV
jgi:hypothetical protein